MADADIFCLFRRAKFAVNRNFIVNQAGPMSGAPAGLAGMEGQHFVAPFIGNCTALRCVQGNGYFV